MTMVLMTLDFRRLTRVTPREAAQKEGDAAIAPLPAFRVCKPWHTWRRRQVEPRRCPERVDGAESRRQRALAGRSTGEGGRRVGCAWGGGDGEGDQRA